MRLFASDLIQPRRRLFIPSYVVPADESPQFGSVGTRLDGDSITSAQVAVPSGVQAGSFVGIWLMTQAGGQVPTLTATPSGFALAAESPVDEDSSWWRGWLYVKIASGNDTGTYDFTVNYHGGGAPWRTGIAFRYEGVDPTTPIEAVDSGKMLSNATYPNLSLTTLGDHRRLLWLGLGYDGDNTYVCNPPTGFGVRHNTNPDATVTVVDKAQAAQGGSGTISATQSGGGQTGLCWLGALKPKVFTVTNLYNYNEPSGQSGKTSITSSSLSIPTGSIVVVYVGGVSYDSAGNAWPTPPSYDFTCVDSVDGATGWNALADSYAANTIDTWWRPGGMAFWKYFSSAVSRTITVDRGGTKKWNPGIDIVAVEGANTSTPVVQSKGNWTNSTGDSVSLTVTLDSQPTQDNCVLWFCAANNDAIGASATPTNYVSLIAPTAVTEATAAAYNTNTTTAAVTSSDLGTSISSGVAAAVEITA